jgi:GT2 family glycosyltransferase
MNPKVSIIILNWNGWEDTIECLESLYQITYPNYEVIVVDNGSEDESIAKLEIYCEGEIKVESEKEIRDLPSNRKLIIIKNEKNYGFAEGNNIGMRYALKALNLNPDYILLLNNDTVVDKEFLRELAKAGMSYGRIGICGAKLLKMHNPKIIDSTGHILRMGRVVDRGTRKIDKGQYDNKTDVIGAMAAACLYKREMLEDIGLFDRSFFTVYEDAELSWRAF